MAQTPSKRRREGREAFETGYSIEECPYSSDFYQDDWVEGWNQGYNDEQAKREEKDWDYIRNQIKNADTLEELKDALLEMYDTKF